MHLALISDIHANLEALEAVLSNIEKQSVDQVHCLGDVIGYGCDPVACIELVEATCRTKLIGNHEYVALGLITTGNMNPMARKSMEWTSSQLSDKEISCLADYSMDAVVEGLRLVHSSPFEPDSWHYILSEEEARLGFDHFEEAIGCIGHTHLPLIFSQGNDGTVRQKIGHDFDPDEEFRYLINIGSVGQPRDNDPRSSYVTINTDEMSVNYHRVEYDIKKAQAKMARAELPTMLIERLEVGR